MGSSSTRELLIKNKFHAFEEIVMTLEENSNGKYFEAWLQEYKTRLEQAKHRGSSMAEDNNNGLSSGAGQERDATETAARPPAFAGEIYVLLQPPAAVAAHR